MQLYLFFNKAIYPLFFWLHVLLEVFQLGVDCMYALQFIVLILMETVNLVNVLLHGAEGKPALK